MKSVNHQLTPFHPYAFGSGMGYTKVGGTQAGRAFSYVNYRFGFNGKEKVGEGALENYDFGARVYDGRIGRWMSVDPLNSVYPGYSPFDFALNTPIQAKDADGKLVIFAHGFILGDGLGNRKSSQGGEKIYTSDYYGKKDKSNDYWECIDDQFMDRLNDHNVRYVNGENSATSQASDRMAEGRLAAKELHKQILSGEIVLQKNSAGEIIETITVVGHSHGCAYSAGMAEELIKLGYKVDAVYYITPHQPGDIQHPAGPLGVQYSHPKDQVCSEPPWWLPNGGTKLAKIKGVSEYKVWQNPAWDLKLYGGDRGGHNVDLNYEIFGFGAGSDGYVRPKPTDNSMNAGQKLELDTSKSQSQWSNNSDSNSGASK